MDFTGLSLIDAALMSVKKNMSSFLDRIHHSYYNDIIHLYRKKIYQEADILAALFNQRQTQLKQNPLIAYLHQNEIRVITQLKDALNTSWNNFYEILNKSEDKLTSSPEIQKILQAFFSIYTHHWQTMHLINEKVLSLIKPLDMIQAHTEYKASRLLGALYELKSTKINDYQLRMLRQKFQSLVNLIARGLLPNTYSSKLATLCLNNLQHTCDFGTYQGFMAGMKYLIPNLTKSERDMLIERLQPITLELKENNYKLLVLQGCLNIYHLRSETELDYIIDQFIVLKDMLINLKNLPVTTENHLFGFDSEAPEPGKTNALQQHMYSSFLSKDSRIHNHIKKYELPKLIAKFHLQLAQVEGPLYDDHYAMLLYDKIRNYELNSVNSRISTNPQP
ncbi:MAG: hypothetical protein BGO90_01880 [Legionella sp. 40-6]|nr:hypothetical protein [Legionella sp.]OJY34099.1 MAG: hypothetical protein BGO90_01880 [Legionella sp. 40-6]